MQNIKRIAISMIIEMKFVPEIAYFRTSTPYVTGSIYDNGLIRIGRAEIGTNNPHKKIIGNLKKFEYVWASKTSFGIAVLALFGIKVK